MLISVIRTIMMGGSVNIYTIIAQILSVLFIIFLILPLHEFAHAKIAVMLGDPTPKIDRRVTLNPMASLDPIGALALLLFGYGWAKPVQVDPRYFKKPKRDMAIVALAGPVSNFLAALVGAILYLLVFLTMDIGVVRTFLSNFLASYFSINIMLAIFNLIPVPPLDGSRIVTAFLSDRAAYNYYKYQNMFYMVFFVLMFSGVLSTPLGIAQNFCADIILNIAKIPFQLLGML